MLNARRLLLVCLGLALQVTSAWSAETIKIAYIAGLSGPISLTSQERLKNFMAAADRVNASGILPGGAKFEIVPFDSKSTPQEGVIVLKQALDQGIRFVAASLSSVSHAIVDSLVKQNLRDPDNAALFLNLSLDPTLTESKCMFWHFRFDDNSTMYLDALTAYMAKREGIKSIYLINPDFATGHIVQQQSREMVVGKLPQARIVGDDLIPLAKIKDFAPYAAKIKASGADSVLTSNFANDLALLIKATHDQGLPLRFYALNAWLPGTAVAIGPTGEDRVKSVGSWHINATDKAWEESMMAAKAKYGALSWLDYFAIYRLMDMLATAIASAGSKPLNVAYALEGMKYSAPSGESWMRPDDHQLISPIYIMKFARSGQPGVKHDEEGTGLGWKTEVVVAAQDVVPPVKCQMERPAR
jgi:branched-chain amino acid transport system substrate-binding protein